MTLAAYHLTATVLLLIAAAVFAFAQLGVMASACWWGAILAAVHWFIARQDFYDR